jgi:hypothetical protein
MTEQEQKKMLKEYMRRWWLNSRWNQIKLVFWMIIELALTKIDSKITNITCKILEDDIDKDTYFGGAR